MKKLIALIALAALQSCSYTDSQKINDLNQRPPSLKGVMTTAPKHDEWGIFVEALIFIESSGDVCAVGSKNDVGILQITPVYVKDVNRILGKRVYTLNCRTDISKSLEMFVVIQNHYNPQKSIEKAIKLHNPLAPDSYRHKIISKMEEIKLKSSVQNNNI